MLRLLLDAIHEPIRDYIPRVCLEINFVLHFFQCFFFVSCCFFIFFFSFSFCLCWIVVDAHIIYRAACPSTNFTVLLNAVRHWNVFSSSFDYRRHLAFFSPFFTFCYNFCVRLNPCVTTGDRQMHLARSLLKGIEFIDDINRYMPWYLCPSIVACLSSVWMSVVWCHPNKMHHVHTPYVQSK